MKLSKLMIAVAAVAAGSAAVAGPASGRILLSSGASATKGNMATALQSLCTAAGGVFKEFASGSNISTYVCGSATTFPGGAADITAGATGTYAAETDAADWINFNGTAYAEVRLNVAGGSFTAMKVAGGQTDDYFEPGTGTSGTLLTGVTGGVGGLMDVEPKAFPSTVLTANSIDYDSAASTVNGNAVALTLAGYVQAFSVGVSDALYTAMFNKQKNPNVGGGVTIDYPIANSCLVTDTTRQDCVPTISKADVAAIISSATNSKPKTQGAEFLGAPAATQLRYIRRVNTSGTQAAAQNYFLGLPAMGSNIGVIPEPTTVTDTNCGGAALIATNTLRSYNSGRYCVIATTSTGELRNELNRATYGASLTNYAIGVLSGENNQSGVNWKWVRVSETQMGEDAKPGAGTTRNEKGMQSGRYDFFYHSYALYRNTDANVTTFFTTLLTGIGNLTLPPGLTKAPALGNATMPYNRNGKADQAAVRGAN